METTPPPAVGSPPSEGVFGEKELLGLDSRPITQLPCTTSVPIEIGSAAELGVCLGVS